MSGSTIEKATEFDDTPHGWAQRWGVELQAATAEVTKWHDTGRSILKRFRDEREARENGETRLNLFTANVLTQQALLYGRVPAVTVERRFADANDDVARVAGEVLERLLNADIERTGDTYAKALGLALQDRLLPGLGQVRVRYVAEFEKVEVEAETQPVPGVEVEVEVEQERKTYECVHTDYVHWGDFRWSPARVWSEVRWVAFANEMSREQLVERFGEDIGNAVPLNASSTRKSDKDAPDPWARAVVWEIWDKPSKRVYWYVEGYGSTLDMKDDPLELEGFFPCPEPLLANTTTDTVLPRPDFVLAQDQYNAVDALSTRIGLLERAVRVAGVYDKANEGVKRLVSEAATNELIPVDNWAMFAEKGGIRGSVDWLPLEQITGAITALSQRREEAKANLYEVTGMSDLLRGQSAVAGVTATEQGLKAKFASVRLQRLQDEFANFATEVQRLKAEVIAKWYDASTVLAQSNAERTYDAQLAAQAVALLKEKYGYYRVAVKPESVSMQDFAQLRAERTELLGALTQFFAGAAPIAQQMPGSMPFLLELLKWFVSGLRGSSQIEGVIDNAIAAAQQALAQPPQPAQQQPDSKVIAQQMKGQQDIAKVQAELQADLARIGAETQAAEQQEANQAKWNVREQAAKNAMAANQRVQNQSSQQGFGGPQR